MTDLDILNLADELTDSAVEISNKKQVLDAQTVYETIDQLAVLNQPITTYFSMKQEEYYETESDKKLTLQELDQPLANLHDRILTNHVDGYVQEDDINLTYNHEDPYESGTYSRKEDMHVLSYSLKVISALAAVVGVDNVKNYLSKDATLSLGLAAYHLTSQK